jgi:transcription antitermination factor NusG
VADKLKWFIIELSEFGETVPYPELVEAIKMVFGQEVNFFVPIYHEQMGSYISTNLLFEGYVFVKDSNTVQEKLSNVKDCRIFSGLLKSCGKIQMLSSHVIGGLRRKLKHSINKDFQVGARVKIKDGIFQNLEGEVQSLEDNGKIANIKIVCLSREILAPIPTTCIEEIRE